MAARRVYDIWKTRKRWAKREYLTERSPRGRRLAGDGVRSATHMSLPKPHRRQAASHGLLMAARRVHDIWKTRKPWPKREHLTECSPRGRRLAGDGVRSVTHVSPQKPHRRQAASHGLLMAARRVYDIWKTRKPWPKREYLTECSPRGRRLAGDGVRSVTHMSLPKPHRRQAASHRPLPAYRACA